MSVYQDWNLTDLAKAAKVPPDLIRGWWERGLLNGKEVNGVLRFPLTESVAVFALRDGKDPKAARDELMSGRQKAMKHEPTRLSKQEIENRLETFRIQNRLPVPNRKAWGDGDPRKEKD